MTATTALPAIHPDCRHRYPHRHGQPGTAEKHGCTCAPCKKAAYRLSKAQNLNGGRTPAAMSVYEPSDKAASLVETLVRSGMSEKAIGQRLGVSASRVSDIHHQHYRRIRKETTVALYVLVKERDLPARYLAVGYVDATGTRRRLQALARRGWSSKDIRDACGLDPKTVSYVKTGRQGQVMASTRDAVQIAYDRLMRKPVPLGPSHSQTRTRAVASGYAPAGAWDNVADMDDPAAMPDPLVQ